MKKKLCAATLILLLCLCVTLWAEITFVSADLTQYSSATDPFSNNFTTASGTDTILLNGVGYNNGSENTNNSTFNGDSLTKQVGTSNAAFASASIWYRVAPDVGTATLAVDFTSANRGTQTGVDLSGVDQSNPFRDSDSANGTTATTSSLTLTTESGDFLLSCIYVRRSGADPGDLVPDDGTEIEESTALAGVERGSCLRKTASGTSTSVGWSWTASTAFAHVAVAVKPSATAAPIIFMRRRR